MKLGLKDSNTKQSITPSPTNMASDTGSFQKEIHLLGTLPQVPCGRGSKIGVQNGTLAAGKVDSHLRNPSFVVFEPHPC